MCRSEEGWSSKGNAWHVLTHVSKILELGACQGVRNIRLSGEWIPFKITKPNVGSSRIRDWTRVSCMGRQTLNHWTTREVPPPFAYFQHSSPRRTNLASVILISRGLEYQKKPSYCKLLCACVCMLLCLPFLHKITAIPNAMHIFSPL